MWGKHCVVVKKLEFPVWHYAFGLIPPKEERGKIQVCSTATNLVSSGHVKRPQSTWRGRKRCRGQGVACIRSSPRRCVGECFYREITAENETRPAHVLRTHGNQQQAGGMPMEWNGVLAYTAATFPNSCVFAYAAVRIPVFPLVTEHTQFRVASIGITFFWHATKMGQEQAVGTIWNARTSSWLVVLTHARETTFAYLARTSLRGEYFSGVLGFLSCSQKYRSCVFGIFAIDRPMSVCFVVFVFLCARITVLVFVFASVILGEGPTRRANPGDATPIAQPRPAPKSKTISSPGQTVHTGGQSPTQSS